MELEYVWWSISLLKLFSHVKEKKIYYKDYFFESFHRNFNYTYICNERNLDSSRWVQAECRKLGDTDNPEVGDLLRTAVRCLKEKPALFKYCAEEVSLSTLLKS